MKLACVQCLSVFQGAVSDYVAMLSSGGIAFSEDTTLYTWIRDAFICQYHILSSHKDDDLNFLRHLHRQPIKQ